jgi:hypothetical protein
MILRRPGGARHGMGVIGMGFSRARRFGVLVAGARGWVVLAGTAAAAAGLLVPAVSGERRSES